MLSKLVLKYDQIQFGLVGNSMIYVCEQAQEKLILIECAISENTVYLVQMQIMIRAFDAQSINKDMDLV